MPGFEPRSFLCSSKYCNRSVAEVDIYYASRTRLILTKFGGKVAHGSLDFGGNPGHGTLRLGSQLH